MSRHSGFYRPRNFFFKTRCYYFLRSDEQKLSFYVKKIAISIASFLKYLSVNS
jgi:hypothetical protein